MRLLLFCGLLTLATAGKGAAPSPVITSHNNAQFHTLHPEVPDLWKTPCDYCQEMVTTLETFAADPQTQKAIVEYVEAAVCTGLPEQLAQMCNEEVPVLVAQAAEEIQQALDPLDTCSLMGICPESGSAVQLLGLSVEQTVSPWDCPMCKMVVMAFVQRLQDREQRQQIETDMRAACDNLSPEAKERCLEDVTNLFVALDNLLHDVDPEGVCRVAEFCEAEAGALVGSGGAVPHALRTLGAALAQLATGAPAAAASDMCQNCKTIVLEASAILQDPKTQTELLEYAKEGCTVFADFKDQCEQYITLYGPLVFNLLISYLQPDVVCTRLGYCTSPPSKAVT